MTDIHLGSPRSYRYQPAWNENWEAAAARIRRLTPAFVLVGGDLTRDGNRHDWELDAARAALEELGMPWHGIPGNMDTGNKHADRQGARPDRDDVACNVTQAQLDQFARHVGPFPWTFEHQGVRFSGCYEAVAGTGLPAARDLERWLGRLAGLPRARWHVMLNHYPLFIDSMDEPAHDPADPDQYLA